MSGTMLKPEEIQIEDMDGVEKTYTITRIPATYAREIVHQYPTSSLPKLGDYVVNEKMCFKMMTYVYAHTADGRKIALDSRDKIDNHVNDWEALARLELAMVQHNTSFLKRAANSNFFENLTAKLISLISQTLTTSSGPSKESDLQQSTNSEQSTT